MQIEELEALLGKKNVTAYLLGMSVIEITRAMRKFKIDIGELSCSSSYGLNKQYEYWLYATLGGTFSEAKKRNS